MAAPSKPTPPPAGDDKTPEIPEGVKSGLKGLFRETLDEWLAENTPKSRGTGKPATDSEGDDSGEDSTYSWFWGRGK